jgi:hypothetical protein
MEFKMKRAIFAILIISIVFVGEAYSQLVAEQITKDNAPKRLFSGSDANGGIGDWYISNGVVEAVIDNAGFQPDLSARGTNLPIQNLISPTGGTLIDLGLVGKNNDQFNQMFQIVNLTPTNSFFYTSVKASVTAELATITAQGFALFGNISTTSSPTLQVQTVYSLAPESSFITVTSTIINMNRNSVPVFNITDATLWTIHGLLPFAPAPGRGFNNPRLSLTAEGIAAALGLYPFVVAPGNMGPADGMIDTMNGAVCGEISYGIFPVSLTIDPDGQFGPMSPNVTKLSVMLGVNSNLVSGLGNPFDPAKSPMLPAGGSLTYTRRIILSDRNDVASISDAYYSSLFFAVGFLSGDIDAEDGTDVEASLIFEGKLPFFGDSNVPVTQVRTDKTGKFSVTLPPGEYNVSVISPERTDLKNIKVTVIPGNSTAVIPKMSSVGNVSFTVTEKGSQIPAKVTFIGLDGTPNPNFSRLFDSVFFDPSNGSTISDVRPSTFKGSPIVNFIFTGDGKGRQSLKPGKYRVIASRGTEYTVGIREITVTAGQETKLDFQLERVVDTTGFVSADFHIHTARSSDSSAPLEDRIRSYVAENVEVLVSTDHDYIIDFAPIIEKLGFGNLAKTIVGEEVTTNLPNPIFPDGFGHHNAFPLLVEPFSPRRGAVNDEYVPAATFYDRVRRNNPNVETVVQLNHPRAGIMGFDGLTSGGVFTTIKFDPTKTIPVQFLIVSQLGTGTRNIDFDCMELYNGGRIFEYQAIRNDWFSLINQGFRKTATAVSDSHRLVIDAPGFPRTYVATPTDDPAAVKDQMITGSVLAGRVMGTSGPFIRFDINGQPLGSLINKKKGKVTLNITVTAPAWVPVEEVRILANGKQIMAFDATTAVKVNPAPSDPTSNQGVERFKASIKVKPKGDTYYTVEAGVKLPLVADTNGDGVVDRGDTNGDGKIDASDNGVVQPPSPPIYTAIAPGFVPLAFTNPIFIDRNGNGKFDPPGVDKSLVPTAVVEQEDEAGVEKGEEDYFPWYKMKVGSQEMEKFFERLTVPERKLARPDFESK